MHFRRRNRCALTLFEILLVLALLVLVGAIAAPAMARFMQTQRLRDSAGLVRAEWARARVQAMKSGRIHVFRFENNGANYTIDFWMADDDALEAGDDSALVQDNDTPPGAEDVDVPIDAKQLPEGIRFFQGEAEPDARSEQAAAEMPAESSSVAGGNWSAPILFYSDGTTSTAEIVLVNERNRAVRISLRGLTGIATVSDVFSAGGAAP